MIAFFQVPASLTQERTILLQDLQKCFTKNYNEICNIIEGGGGTGRKTQRSLENWGATAIQGGRYMIKIDKSKKSSCLNSIVKKYKLSDSLCSTLIEMATSASASEQEGGDSQGLSQFYILFTKKQIQQEPHIDLFHPLVQYGMMITPGEDSTLIYDQASVEKSYQVSSMNSLVKLLAEEDLYPKGCLSAPSPELLKQIEALPSSPDSTPSQIAQLGSLFNIASPHFI